MKPELKKLLILNLILALILLNAKQIFCQYNVLNHFAGTSIDGAQPAGEVIHSDGFLYGVSRMGGSANGQKPFGSVILMKNTLYGAASDESTGFSGKLYSLKTDGSGYTILHTFEKANGQDPNATLFMLNSILYGTSYEGGSKNKGVLFSYKLPEPTSMIDYYGQTPPGDTAVVFAQGNISLSNRWESKITFSPKGDELFFVISGTSKDGIYHSKKEGDSWSAPAIASFQGSRIVGNPYFSLDGSKVYFDVWNSSYTNCDIWVSEKTTTGWGDPKVLSNSVNSTAIDQSYCETAGGDVYITTERSGNYDLWCWNHETGIAGNLGTKINASSFDSDPCIAPDGSFLIFSSDRSGKIGGQDLYICFKNGSDWTTPTNMELAGAQINLSKKHQVSPSLSPDGKYLFFTRHSTPSTSMTMDIYWVSTNIITKLKNTIFAPKVSKPLPNVTITTDSTLSMLIPETTFACEYGIANLAYSATLMNGTALPAWLSFDASTRTLSGKPTKAETDTIAITATNTDGISATATFVLTVEKGQETTIDYLGQTTPGDSAVIFAPGLISLTTRREYKVTFSPAGSECYLGYWDNNTGKVHYLKNENGTWSEAIEPSFSTNHNVSALTFSPVNNKLFFNYDNSGICSIERTASGWGTVTPLTSPTNSSSYHYAETADSVVFVASTRSGSISSSVDLWCIKRSADQTIKATNMGSSINTSSSEFAPCVSSDGSYLIFTSDRSGGVGKQDLYISYKKEDGSYTPALNMEKAGASINIKNYHQTYPSLSPDEKYLFFSRHEPDLDPWDIYWVNIEKLIPALKQITFAPKVSKALANKTITTDSTLSMVIPETTFACEYGTANLAYSATLINGTALPAWLSFEAPTRSLSGKPTKAETDTIAITATNTDGISATATFVLTVEKGNETTVDYLGQTPPGLTPEIFAKGIVSNANAHGRLVFSPDKTRILWTTLNRSTYATQIIGIACENSQWSTPSAVSFATTGLTKNPVYSCDGSKLFFNQRNSISDVWSIKYVLASSSSWNETKTDGYLLNTTSSFTIAGKVYYSDTMGDKGSYGGIYSASWSAEGFVDIQALSSVINSSHVNYTPYIAPDGTYLIFSSSRPSATESLGNMYLYISFRNSDETWTEPKKMFTVSGRFPSLSPDGKYLFFCGDDGNYYWVDAAVINQFKPSASNKIRKKSDELLVYPNPTAGEITLDNLNETETSRVSITLTSAEGRIVKSCSTTDKQLTLNLSDLPKGMYNLTVAADRKVAHQKIILK